MVQELLPTLQWLCQSGSGTQPAAVTLREGTAWAALVLAENTALSPLYIHLYHAGRVILFLTP